MNRLIEAMCHTRRGDREKAQAAFDNADKLLRQTLANVEFVHDTYFWHDWLICKILYDEARSVLVRK